MSRQISLFENSKDKNSKNQIQKAKKKSLMNHKANSYTGFYRMHKYWSKKPYNVIRHFIEEYSQKGDIVLDPFSGSGVSVSESVFTGRKGFGIDINPSAIFITEQQLSKVEIGKFEKEFKKLEDDLKEEINSFYTVKRGNKKEIGSHFIWENGDLTEIWYRKGRKKVIDSPQKDDLDLCSSFSYEKIPFFYPKTNFFANSRINTKEEMHIYDLFTPRNLNSLSLIMNRIEKIEDKSIKDLFKLCFTAALGQASKMVFVINRNDKSGNSRREVGSWVIGYWIPKENMEINAWNCFENRYKTTLRAKKEFKKLNTHINNAKNFEDLLDSSNLLLINAPAQKALKKIPSNSIDYIITDPPHGDRQPYLELSTMWNAWLKKENTIDYESEIIVSNAKKRNKTVENYYKLLDCVLTEIERVLKPGKYFSLMFNSIDDKTWANLIIHLNKLNFKIEKIETLNYSANSVVQDNRKGGLKTDFILTFKKVKKEFQEIEFISVKENKNLFVNKINKYLESDLEGLETYMIFNSLVHDFLSEHKFFKLSEIINLLKSEYKNKNGKWVIKYEK